MISFFWKRGFYLTGRLFFYTNFTLLTLYSTFWGLGITWLRLITTRLELPVLRSGESVFNSFKNLSQFNLHALTETMSFLFNFYLIVTFPVFLNMEYQKKINLLFHYLIRSSRGLKLFINKPLSRRTRARTYRSSKKLQKQDLKLSWF